MTGWDAYKFYNEVGFQTSNILAFVNIAKTSSVNHITHSVLFFHDAGQLHKLVSTKLRKESRVLPSHGGVNPSDDALSTKLKVHDVLIILIRFVSFHFTI